MFLAILSGSVIALALIAQADRFGTAFTAIAIFMLAVVFFTGAATIRRLMMLNRDDYHMVVGMNRLRHGYFDLHPELEPYFITSPFDDLSGTLRTLGIEQETAHGMGSFFHGFVTLPGMVGVIVASVGGAIGGLAAVGFGAPAYVAILAGAAILSLGGRGVEVDAGAVLIAAACLAWGIDNNLTRKLSSADPVLTAMIKGLAAGTVNAGVAMLSGAAIPAAAIVGASAIVGFAGIGISLVLFVLALRHLGTARTSAYFSLAPFIGAVLAIGLLHETATVNLALAGLLMGFGLWVHLAERHEHEHPHEALEHEHSHRHDAHHRHTHDGPVSEPHSYWHRHTPLRHSHPHYPDLHHRHGHG